MEKPREGQRREHNVGITLIALIITIIILLILAMITIRILMNQGIIGHANDATSQYKIAEEKEKIALGYQNYKMDKIANANATVTVDTATVEGSEAEGGWTITFTETGNVYELDTKGNITKTEDPAQDEIAKIQAGYNKYVSDKAAINSQIEQVQAEATNNVNQTDLDLLTQYCIGNNDKDLLEDVLDAGTMKFKNNVLIPNASEELINTGMDQAEVSGNFEIYIYFTYKGNSYRLISGFEYDSDSGVYGYPTKSVGPDSGIGALQNQLSSLLLTVEDATVKGDGDNGWTVRFEETTNTYTVSSQGEITGPISDINLIKKYFIGASSEGKEWEQLKMNSYRFKDDLESIPDASNSLYEWTLIFDTEEVYHYISYNKIIYKISVNRVTGLTKDCEKFYRKQGEEGKTVQYSIDGNDSSKSNWMVLYDNGTTVDIICENTVGNITLGREDLSAEGVNDVEKAIYSYNNAVDRLNNYCKSLVANPTAQNVRSAGSNPNYNMGDTIEMYYSNDEDRWDISYNGKAKIGDLNAEQDIVRIDYLGKSKMSGEDYWLASREIQESGGDTTLSDDGVPTPYLVDFGLRGGGTIWEMREITPYGKSVQLPVRPVVRVNKSDVGL